jgi:predicted MPP superfamily phosphohydrolase
MHRRFRFLLFLFLWGSIVAFIHWYLALRLVLLPQLPSPYVEAAIAAFVVLGSLLFTRPVIERLIGPRFAAALAWPTFLWMGASFLLLVVLLATDVTLSLAGGAAWAVGDPRVSASVSDETEAAFVVIGAMAASLYALLLALRPPRLRAIELPLADLPEALDGFRIVQLSDLHIGPLRGRRFAAALVARVNSLSADLVAVTGDLVDGNVERLASEVSPLAGLESRHGTFFVSGNHEYFSRIDPWLAVVRDLGWRVLRNERVTIRHGEGGLDVAGVDDHLAHHYGNGHGQDVAAALDGRNPARPVVLLAHHPNAFDEASELGVSLQLSGHTHGGQIWPFQYLVRLSTPYVAGVFRRGRSTLYVSRGTGFWGPPMRLFHPGEITEITLRAAVPLLTGPRFPG